MMVRAKRRWAGVSAVVATAVWLSACGDAGRERPRAAEPEVPEADRYGGTIVVAGAGDIETFNPAAATDELSYQIQRHVLLMTLLSADANLEPVPRLAESWEINGDSTGVVFHLRRDVRWHDGLPTTAHDVAWTFTRVRDPDVGFPNAEWFEGWDGPEVLDDWTIRFAVRPRAGLLAGWTRLPILPRHLFTDTDPADLARHAFGSRPTGNGPFRFVEAREGDRWVFEANHDFPAELGGRPYADRLIYRAIPEPATQLAELRTGGVHFVRRISPTQLPRASADPEIRVVEYPSRAYGLIAWNGQRPLFRDPAIRRALTMALDRQAIVDAVQNGLGEVANGPLGPWHPAYDAGRAPIAFAPDSARATLDRAGWRDTDGDGIRDREGTPLSFELMTSGRDTYRDIAQIVQAQLASIGVRVEIRTVEAPVLFDAIVSPERRFDAFVLEWEPDLEVDDRQLFSCEAVGETFQFSSYCNRALEPILDSIPRARSTADRDRLLRAYASIVNRDQPFTFLYFARDAAAMSPALRGVKPDIRGDLVGVQDWWLLPSARTDAAAPGSP